ncbi:hypothetical protein AB0H83_15405 [Dactylosporangium sp. NPDC050688]|uniref:hypothetical protein n=1 Tax=Dactylosporangium sp. NPDC050688 TaxID=3157217 RepID=UPI00340A4FB3
MELRAELLPPAVAAERLAAVQARIAAIRDLLDRGDPRAAAEIAALNDDTGHEYTAGDLRDHCGGPELDELAAAAAAPPIRRAPEASSVTRDELVEIVRRILAADRHAGFYVSLFEANVVMPGAAELIFYPPPYLADSVANADADADAEQIVEAALAYRPIAL